MYTMIELIRETEFDFSGLPASAELTHTLIRGVDVVPYRSGKLIVRIHDRTMAGAAQAVFVQISAEAPTPQDPLNEFEGSTIGDVTFVPTDPSPGLYLADLTTPLPSHVRICLCGRQHTVAGTTLLVTLSVGLALRR